MNQNSVQSFPASVSQTFLTGQPVKFDGTKGSVTAASGATGNIGVVIGDYVTDSATKNTAVAVQLISPGSTALIKIKTKTSATVGAAVIIADGGGWVVGTHAYGKANAWLLEDGTAANGAVVRAVFVQ
jgi:hypothetical protein